jgi:predicted DNA-binding WGR domain protein
MMVYYLELSNPEKGEHKFYELTTHETSYLVRYGRIGTNGQTKLSEFETADAMLKSADKTIVEKIKKGYQQATIGQTSKQETQHQAILRLAKSYFTLISNGYEDLAKQCYIDFKEFIEDEDNKIDYEYELVAFGIMESADDELTFHVDWKDTESMLYKLDSICDNLCLDVEFDWGCEDPEEDLDVPQIMVLAHQQLQKIGFALWYWNMDSDDYNGWVAPISATEKIAEVVAQLGLKASFVSGLE